MHMRTEHAQEPQPRKRRHAANRPLQFGLGHVTQHHRPQQAEVAGTAEKLQVARITTADVAQHHNLFTKVIPTRFNRQRREVCFMPDGATEPLFVPWESLSAWVVQAQGATQYGVTRQYGMGMGFEHEGELVRVEFQCGSVQLAISNWEAVRGYMEYELNDLSALQDPLGLQEPGDPPHEGLHTFRNARAGLHRRLREKEVGRIYAFFWYVYHVMTLWTLPNRLVEWEIKRIAKVGRRALPPAMQAWSEPLPPEQWAKPSSELLRLSAKVKALIKRHPRTPITEIYAEVYRNEPNPPRSA